MTFKNATLKLFIGTFLTVALISCGGDSSTDKASDQANNDTTSIDFADMTELSLQAYDLNMSIMLPEVASATGNAIDPLVTHEEGDYLWNVAIGQRFSLIIEDFGKEMNKVEQEKKRLKELETIFEIEYLVDEPSLIMYKRKLHEGQGGKPSYHCYGEELVGGYNYVLKSDEEGSLKPIIEDMVKTIRSARSLQGA